MIWVTLEIMYILRRLENLLTNLYSINNFSYKRRVKLQWDTNLLTTP